MHLPDRPDTFGQSREARERDAQAGLPPRSIPRDPPQTGDAFDRSEAEYVEKINVVLERVRDEMLRARRKHGPRAFASHHEGYGVLAEEFREFEADVFADRVTGEAQAEAIQIAAMAVRFVIDVPIRTNTRHIGSPPLAEALRIVERFKDSAD